MTQLLIGLVRTENEAIIMLNKLKEEGIADKYLGAVAKEQVNLEVVSEKTGLPMPLKGAGTDGALGVLKGVLAGLGKRMDQTMSIGKAVRKLAGNEIGNETDDLVLTLTEAGVSEEDANYYEDWLVQGHILVVVECSEEEAARIAPILLF
ncbi:MULTISPECIES: general stress protein [unclassified Paenibacillus]|uniref:general stress protein n=1 Tax=unclassified Paenibacillus TaxID=185978 RepID=UPI0009A8F8DF|nr:MULTISPECIES: general stress protein [unclassified Paenibacillus]SLJ92903.1 Heat induced stress protein YflT [Paenibacillus sp. RU5A]SOC58462.1 Heat induced stress protein YflT [Paenibacillus sp. RU26A]SOC67514.1 Heat induced stress protein YflT [Paenibacillus sp. RU5M]